MQVSDDDLDRLSQEAAENFNPSGASPDWGKMELLLNKHLPVNKKPRRRIFILLFVLLFILGGGYLYNIFTGNDEFATVEKAGNSTGNSTAFTTPDKNSTAPIAAKGEETNPGNKGIAIESPQLDKTVEQKNSVKSKKSGKARLTVTQADISEGSIPTKDEPPVSSEAVLDTDNNEQQDISKQKSDSVSSLTVAPGVPMATNDQKAVTDTNKIKEATEQAGKKKPVSQKTRPLEITLLYAPELTTIGWTHIDKPGSNYGLLVGYKLTKGLTLQTGIIKSKKNYTANEEDVTLPYSPTSYKFLTMEGYCKMVEIPLNAKFYLAGKKKYNIFGIAGISSYFMTKEFYTFHYHNSIYDRSLEYNEQRNYWFSIATIGAGIERDLSDNFNIGVSPFMKIPFTGMGKGELKLQGVGINFLLTYKPAFTKKNK